MKKISLCNQRKELCRDENYRKKNGTSLHRCKWDQKRGVSERYKNRHPSQLSPGMGDYFGLFIPPDLAGAG
jgi:hypothetical protein